MVGSVIQATRKVDFEDGLGIRNHLKAQNSLQRVRTIPADPVQAVCFVQQSSSSSSHQLLLEESSHNALLATVG